MRAKYWELVNGTAKNVRCTLCPHFCVISPGKVGKCKVRKNINGVLEATQWGEIATAAMDPIEKKPLFHFHPGSDIFSIGGFGCNFSCAFCQNWQLSTTVGSTYTVTANDVLGMIERSGASSVAFTYNEPIVNCEFCLEIMKLCRGNGIKTVFVTNGFINPEPLSELLPFLDAANIDIKAMKNEYYVELCGASLPPVLNTIKFLAGKRHVELTCLIVTGKNDSNEELNSMGSWISENCGKQIPLHISAYFPAHKAKFPQTPIETLKKAHEIF